MIVSMCPDVLFNRHQPLAGFVTSDGDPAYYCAACLPTRVEEALREGFTAQDIATNISFSNCGHIEDNTGACGPCAKGVTAMLVYLSTTLHLKVGKHELLTRLGPHHHSLNRQAWAHKPRWHLYPAARQSNMSALRARYAHLSSDHLAGAAGAVSVLG